jgi:hypothetical protein
MKTVTKPCLQCEKEFDAPLREVKRGNGKFCTRKCSAAHRVSKIKPKKANVECAQCKKSFYKNESKKKQSKSGLFFCSRSCKDVAQKIGGIEEIMPSHYGTGNCYRSICWSHHEKICLVCGEDKIVAVHHYDENHQNNDPKNLVPLCPTHHLYVHSSYKYLVEEKIEEYLKKRWGDTT